MGSEVEEQMYLLEIIVEDVYVSEEGILDWLREQVEIAEQQLKQNDDGKDALNEVSAKDNVNPNEVGPVENKTPSDPNPSKENPHPPSPEKKPKQKTKRTAPVEVLAQFLDFPVLEIKEIEFEKYIDDIQGGSKTQPNLQQGKSCLFSMSPKEMMDAIRKHPIVVQLHREGSNNEPAHLIGMTRICLGQEFIDTIALGNTPTIAVTTIQGDYDVTNIFGDVTATVSLAIRLSCVGPSITTQFTYNQFDGNVKFSSNETVTKTDAAKNRSGRQGPIGAFFHKDDALGIAVGLPPDCKLSSSTIPWRKLHEDPVDVRSCGPKRLFKEQAESCYVDDTFDSGEFNPGWAPNVAKVMMAKCPGGVCCGGQPAQTSDFVPSEFGTSLPPEVKKLLPLGKNEYEVPLDAQFASMNVNWCNPPKPPKGECNRKSEMRVCCAMTGQSGMGQTSGCPCMAPQPVYVCSNPKVNSPPPLEEAGPHLKSSPADKQETSSFKRHLQYVPCPNAPDTPNTGNVTCGLEVLLNQQNLKNLLRPSLMAPVCPPDSSGRWPSLCTCPKVPTVVPQSAPGGVLRCECTNILTTMKPIELPYTCPKPQEQWVEEAPTCQPCPPVPIKLPPPAPECPLAKLLKESQDSKVSPPTNTPAKQSLGPSSQQVTPTRPPKTEIELPDTVTDSNKSTTFPDTDTAPKTANSKPDHSPEKIFEKIKKGHKVLQDEVARSTTITTNSMEPQMERVFSKRSKTASSSASSVATVSPKKRKRRQKVDEGRGSGYTPTRIVEPQEKELKIIYTSTAGKYPGYVIGHKNCIPMIPRVPKRMGWLWNIKDADGFLKPGRGWRPGSIQTTVMKVMDTVKWTGKTNASNKSSKPPPVLAKTKSGEQHSRKVESARQMTHKTGDAPLMAPSDLSPTLHVHKKHGLHYVSMIPPPKENQRKKPKIKRMNSRGDTIDESDSVDSLPAQFRIDTKNPDGLFGDRNLYETDDSSTVSEDSYQMEVVAPSSLRHRQRQPVKTDMEVQVTENDFIRPAVEYKSHEGKADTKKHGRPGKKKSSAASQKGKRGKGSFKNKK